MIIRKIKLLICILFVGSFFTPYIINNVFAAEKAPSLTSSASQNKKVGGFSYAWFFGWEAEFLKINIVDLSLSAMWLLPRVNNVAQLLPENSATYRNYWYPRSFLFDKYNGRLYGVFPKAIISDITTYEILVFQLPLMEVVGEINFPQNIDGAPNILLTPNGKELFVNYREFHGEERSPNRIYYDVIDIFDTGNLKKKNSIKVKGEIKGTTITGNEPSLFFFEKAYLAPNENDTIYDWIPYWVKRIKILDKEALQEQIDPVQALPESQRSILLPFEYIHPATKKKTFSYSIADSKAGRVLIRMAKQSGERKVMFTIDLAAQQITPIIDIPGPCKTYLTPDGKQIIVEGIDITKEKDSDGLKTNKTGKFWLYDVLTGKQIREFKIKEELAGSEKSNLILCIAPDNSLMFYAANTNLYAINLIEDEAPKKINVDFNVGPATICVFTDR